MPRPSLHTITPSRLIPTRRERLSARRHAAAIGLGAVLALSLLALLLIGAVR